MITTHSEQAANSCDDMFCINTSTIYRYITRCL